MTGATWRLDLYTVYILLVGSSEVFFGACYVNGTNSYFCVTSTLGRHSVAKVSSANLLRSYRRAPKGAGTAGDQGVEGGGICHLCECGQGIDWEDLFLSFASRLFLCV